MKTLGERLLGKTLKSIEASGLNYGIVFDDGSAFTIYTAIRANLNCVEGDRTVRTRLKTYSDSLTAPRSQFRETKACSSDLNSMSFAMLMDNTS
jgi:hypothetical protein